MKRRIKGFLLLIGSFIVFSGCKEEGDGWYFPAQATETVVNNEDLPGEPIDKIVVYICGAVKEPGVVSLDKDSRVVDAIAMAGGFTQEADETYINLAGKLQDGEKVYVPTLTEVSQWKAQEQKEPLININTAGLEELCKLPGIGESKAADIIAYREKQGLFQKKEDLMKVPGIKQNLYEKIEDKIIVK